MDLYHSTTQKHNILNKGTIKVNRRFNYLEYLKHALRSIYLMNEPIELIDSYPGSQTHAPFMGNGIYCFDTLNAALNYQSNAQAVHIVYSNEHNYFDFYDEQNLLDTLFLLEEIRDHSIDSQISDHDARDSWKLLIEFLIACLIAEFKQCQPAVGLLLFVLNYMKKMDSPDLISRTFYHPEKNDIHHDKYYLIANAEKIVELC